MVCALSSLSKYSCVFLNLTGNEAAGWSYCYIVRVLVARAFVTSFSLTTQLARVPR